MLVKPRKLSITTIQLRLFPKPVGNATKTSYPCAKTNGLLLLFLDSETKYCRCLRHFFRRDALPPFLTLREYVIALAYYVTSRVF